MSEWTPDNPAWEEGCSDEFMANAETEATADMLEEFFPIVETTRKIHVLDVGAGSGRVGKRLFFKGNTALHQCDVNEVAERHITRGDVRDLYHYACGEFDIVHCRRVISNLHVNDRPKAVEELWRVLRPGGLLYIIDCFYSPYQKINDCREAAGLARLKPHMGKQRVSESQINAACTDGTQLCERVVAPEYYVSSRLVWPCILGNFAPPPLKWVTFTLPNVDHLCPHKILVFEKE